MGSKEIRPLASSAAGKETLTRVKGGLNNEVFFYDDPVRGRVCRKVFKQDGRDREHREWWALTRLSSLGVSIAPAPIRANGAVIDMAWVQGEPMNNQLLSDQQLAVLHDVLDELYALPVEPDVRPITGNPAELVERLRRMLGSTATKNRSLDAVREWIESDEPIELARLPLTQFGRGDTNLANCLWNDGQITLIDWEYAGRSARAYELADHVEHLQARQTDWTVFVERFSLSETEMRHYLLSRRLLAAYWLLLLQPGTRGHELNPKGALEAQEQRVLALFRD